MLNCELFIRTTLCASCLILHGILLVDNTSNQPLQYSVVSDLPASNSCDALCSGRICKPEYRGSPCSEWFNTSNPCDKELITEGRSEDACSMVLPGSKFEGRDNPDKHTVYKQHMLNVRMLELITCYGLALTKTNLAFNLS